MSIITPTNFNVQAQIHIDTRLTQADITARDLISTPTRYWGMIVHVLDSDGGNNPNTYILQKGTTSIDIFDNGNWQTLSELSGGWKTVGDTTLTGAVEIIGNATDPIIISSDATGIAKITIDSDAIGGGVEITGKSRLSRVDIDQNGISLNAVTAADWTNPRGGVTASLGAATMFHNNVSGEKHSINMNATAGSQILIQGGGTFEFAGDYSAAFDVLSLVHKGYIEGNGAGKLDRIGFNLTTGDVTTPAEGQIWYNNTSNKFRVFQGAGPAEDMVGAGGGGWAVTGTTTLTGAVTIDTSTSGYDVTFTDTSAANDSDFAIGVIAGSNHFRTFSAYVDTGILLRDSSNDPMLDLSPGGAAVFGLNIELGYAAQTGSSRDIATKGTVPPYMTFHSDTNGSYYFNPSSGNKAVIFIKGTFGDVGLELHGGSADLIEGGYDSGNPLTIQARQQLTQDGQAALILRTEDTTRTNDDSGNVEIRTGAPDGAGVAGDVFVVNDTTESARFKDGGIQLSGEPTQTFKTAYVQLTQGQIQALKTTPIEIIALPGSGKYIQIIGASANYAWNSTSYALTGGGTIDNIQLSQGAQVIYATHITGGASMIVNAGNKIRHFMQADGTASTAPDIGMNIAIDIDSLSDYTGAGGTIDVYVQYVIIDTN